MNKIIVLLLLITLSLSCTRIAPRFEDSNQMFIEKVISHIPLGEMLIKTIPKHSKVALSSMEKSATLDNHLIAMLEDVLIQSLINNNFRVMERDENVLFHFQRENRNHISESKQNHNEMIILENKIGVVNLSNSEKQVENIETDLTSSDYLISYRVLECGILFRDKSPKGQEYKSREGMVRLHIRVQNTQSGKILLAGNFVGQDIDEIRKDLIPSLSTFHYSFFANEYQLQHENADGRLILKSSVSE